MSEVRKVFELIVNSKRIPDNVEESIRLAIIKGVLEPGTRVEEKQIAEEFLISETTVREALILLEADGYINFRRGAGYYVESLEKIDLRDMYQLAAIITKASIQSIDNMDAFLCGVLDQSIIIQDNLDDILQERKFHVSIAMISRNNEYINAMKRIYNKIEWWYRTIGKENANADVLSSHDTIARAIKSHRGTDYTEIFNLVDDHYKKHLKEALK